MKRRRPSLPYRVVQLTLAACALAATSVAHHPPRQTLPAGLVPCVDAGSIVVADDATGTSWAPGLKARLLGEASALLPGLRGDAAMRDACRGEDGYVRLDLSARKLDPTVYLDVDDATYGLRVDLRVGRYEEHAAAPRAEPEFHVFMADLHAEADAGKSIHERLLAEGRHAFLTLTAAQAAAPPTLRSTLARALTRPPILAPVSGLVLALLVVFALPPILARSRRTPRAKGTQP